MSSAATHLFGGPLVLLTFGNRLIQNFLVDRWRFLQCPQVYLSESANSSVSVKLRKQSAIIYLSVSAHKNRVGKYVPTTSCSPTSLSLTTQCASVYYTSLKT